MNLGPFSLRPELMDNTNVPMAGKTEMPGPEPMTNAPEAKSSSGPESSASVPGPRFKRPRRSISGARELRCMECGGFLGEVKGSIEASRFRCHRCKAWSSFAFTS